MDFVGLAAAIKNDMPWADKAACAGTDPEAFFPDRGGNPHPAKKVCRDCPVRQQCLDYALKHAENWGIWGGLTDNERRSIRRGHHPPIWRPECGTAAGADKHYKRGEPVCGPCRAAKAQQLRQSRARLARTQGRIA